ncbi:hypothetical protein JL722_2817 [Aureococcus anophagefferens]|nr:hypothetical protein JL722_2817 [Aureococcus anophagefferens]
MSAFASYRVCSACDGEGDVAAVVAVVGGGRGRGRRARVAAAPRVVAFEADAARDARPQGYAFTLQQGSSALRSLGVAVRGASPTRHASFDCRAAAGTYAPARAAAARAARGERRLPAAARARRRRRRAARRRRALRPPVPRVREGHAPPRRATAPFDVVVGADGVHSAVRALAAPEAKTSYLGYVVALGLAPAAAAPPELRGATWQVVDGERARVYSMPFDGDESASTDGSCARAPGATARVMWQCSWREPDEAKARRRRLPRRRRRPELDAVLAAARVRPFAATDPADVVAYAIRDADAATSRARRASCSRRRARDEPFKGQGANQALLDALALARALYRVPELRGERAPPRDRASVAAAIARDRGVMTTAPPPRQARALARTRTSHPGGARRRRRARADAAGRGTRAGAIT